MCVCPKKTMLILNIFIYKSFYEKKEKRNLQDIIVVQRYEIVKIQMHFWSNYLIFWFLFTVYNFTSIWDQRVH
jgi:hypothetical protein